MKGSAMIMNKIFVFLEILVQKTKMVKNNLVLRMTDTVKSKDLV